MVLAAPAKTKRGPGRPRTKPLPSIDLPHNWVPRDYQAPFWFYMMRGGKRAVLRWHRRSGKDDACLHWLALAAHMKIATYWYMLPEYSQARKSMWDAINPHTGKRRIDEAFPEILRRTTRDQEMMIVFKNGSTFQLVGADNFNSLVGSPPYGLVFSEYALTNPAAWGYLSPILLENGGWAIFNSTPRGNNHFKKLCEFAHHEPGWFYQVLTAEDSKVFTQVQLQRMLRQEQSDKGVDHGLAFWKQEYQVSFDAAAPGAIWADCVIRAEAEGRIVKGTEIYDPTLPVSTAWDLGFTDDTAIWWFQVGAGEVLILDYYESNNKSIKDYADVLREREGARGWKRGTHWLPHDARPRTLAAGGKSILQQIKEEDVGRVAIQPRLDREEGIQAARATFPRCRFDGARCAAGLESLRNYHRKWDDELKIFSMTPVHDGDSHAADAWRGLSLVWRNPKSIEPEGPLFDRLMKGNIRGQTFGELKTKFLARKRASREMRME